MKDNNVVTHITGPVWFAGDVDTEWMKNKLRLDFFMGRLEAARLHTVYSWLKELVNAIEGSPEPFMLDLSFKL
jgi:hypothetical protein